MLADALIFHWATSGILEGILTDYVSVKSKQIQQIIRIQNNKNWEALLAYLLRTKVSFKAAEIAATRLLKSQSFFVCHATYTAFFKKNPTYWDYYIMTNSLTCIIAHLIN